MNVKSLKKDDLVMIKSWDHASQSSSWLDDDAIDKDNEPMFLESTGRFIKLTKHKYPSVVLCPFIAPTLNKKYGVTLYIPVGCIISIRKLK